MADVRDRLLSGPDAQRPRVKLELSAISTLARVSGCAPDDISADPAKLRHHLSGISPAMAGLTRGSWASVRSRLLRALQRADVEVMAGRRVSALTADWNDLYRALPANGQQASLGRFIGYLSNRCVGPHAVDDAWMDRFAQELETTSMRGRPSTIVRGAIRGWNTATEMVKGWPPTLLTPPGSLRIGYVLYADKFSPSFQASLSDHIHYLANPPEDDDNAPLRGLRPTTLRMREFQLRQIASALVHKGVPIETITSVAGLATQEHIDLVCEFFTEHHGRPDSIQLQGMLQVLRPLAVFKLQDKALGERISRRMRRLASPRGARYGMTEKNRRRLAVFRDPKLVRDMLLLPFNLLKRAETGELPEKQAAQLVRAAVAVELEIMCPIRLQNLSEINVDTDLVRSHARKGAVTHLFIPGDRTKNGEDIEVELPRPTTALIDLYLAKYRHHLIHPEHRGNGPRFLFPRPSGAVKSGKVLAGGISAVLERELGIQFNIHLFRHLGCFLFLRAHPGQIEVMRRVLGHKDVTTTIRFYASVEQSDAFRQFDKHVLQIREDVMRPSKGRPRDAKTKRQL
jgi:integrase